MGLPREGEGARLRARQEAGFVDGLVVLARIAGISRDGAPRAVRASSCGSEASQPLSTLSLPAPEAPTITSRRCECP